MITNFSQPFSRLRHVLCKQKFWLPGSALAHAQLPTTFGASSSRVERQVVQITAEQGRPRSTTSAHGARRDQQPIISLKCVLKILWSGRRRGRPNMDGINEPLYPGHIPQATYDAQQQEMIKRGTPDESAKISAPSSGSAAGHKRKRMGAQEKFYAVKEGHRPGVYTSWPDCQREVKGYARAICTLVKSARRGCLC